ncbi:DsbA family protein [Patescibacteria group bacterium]
MNSNIWKTVALILIGALLGYMVGRFELTTISISDETTKNTNVEEEDKKTDTVPEIELKDATVDDDPFLGPENAQVVIIDFSDYQCPFCKKFYTNIFPEFKKDFLDTNKVKYVYRDFPLNIHPPAKNAAQAAQCAGDQNSYWEMHELLFEKQSEWGRAVELNETLIGYAVELGLNKATFSSCLNDEKYLEEVEKDRIDALASGAKGTPTLFVNGKIIRGVPQSYESFKALIESELE